MNDDVISFNFSIPEQQKINANATLNENNIITVDLINKSVDAAYIFEQLAASDTWIIEHNLGKYPSVTLVDSAGTQFFAEVEYNSINQCTIYMNGACKGKAYLN